MLFYFSLYYRSPLDAVLGGYLTLVDLELPEEGLKSSETRMYSGVQAKFCYLSWEVQAQDPSKVPMFKDIIKQSPRCKHTVLWTDFYKIARKAEKYDNAIIERDKRNRSPAYPDDGPTVVDPTAFVFHETRCGSTLIANILAVSDPMRTRVYSEAPPISIAANSCMRANIECDPDARSALLQDVFYMMGRIRPRRQGLQRVFYKLGATGALSIDAITQAVPDTPWMYVYRDPTEVMMSHFKNYQKGKPLSEDFSPVCIRQIENEYQHPLLEGIVQAKGRTIESLSKEEYCAAHLAALCESAIQGHRYSDNDTKHWLLNYSELPIKMWETVLPQVLETALTARQIERMEAVSNAYSKGRGHKAGKWQDDVSVKQEMAPDSVREAVTMFLEPSYQLLEAINGAMKAKG